MSDPYQVLGVSRNASDDEIKSAYRDLVRKYHPDNYANNPLADLASEKMKEINEAYEQIQKMRKGSQQTAGGYGYSQGYQGAGSYQSQGSSQFADIRRLIQSQRIAEAQELLDGVPQARRDAEWYFLMGSVFYTRGWLDQALRHFNQAVSMNPNNPEYRATLNQMMWRQQSGTSPYGGYRTAGQPAAGGCDLCDCCAMWACCDCLGNGLCC